MASYTELEEVGRDPIFRDKVLVAVAVAADAIRQEDAGTANHAERLAWAKTAVADLKGERDRILPMILAANKGATKQNIIGATDSAIQSNVDAVVNFFAV